MRISIINKLLIRLFLCFIVLVSCKNEKICDIDSLIQRVYSGEDISILEQGLNKRVGQFQSNQVSGFSELNTDVRLIGLTYVSEDTHVNPLPYLWFYSDHSNYEKGLIVLYLDRYVKGKGFEVTHNYYLRDYKLIPGFSKNYTHFNEVSYGDAIINNGYTRYNIDEKIYGIYAYEGKYPPYNKKVKPKYLVYVENNKLVVEEPKDDKYFIYRIPEL